MKNERKILQRELADYLREKDRAALRELRARIHSARVNRRHMLSEARQQCRTARASLKEQQALERQRFRDEQRGARAAERSACAAGKDRARAEGGELEHGAKGELKEARTLQRQVRNADKRGAIKRSTARERASEDDDAVRRNLPAELVPVFDAVRKKIKGTPRKSRTETFLEWAEENPDEILAMQQSEADEYLRDLLKQQREHGRTVRKAGRYSGTPEVLRAELARVPF